MSRVDDLISRYYGNLDYGQRALEHAVQQALNQGRAERVLDAGCGWDAPLTRKYSHQTTVVGIDLSEKLPADLCTVRGDLSALPFRDGSFSLIYSRSVFEHLSNPKQVLDEFGRVLRPGGLCVIITPAKYDYSSIIAAMTPQWFHQWFVNKVYGPAAEYDTFPVLYRANTPRFYHQFINQGDTWKLRGLSGLRHYPCNLMFSRALFRLGVAYDWLLDRLRLASLQPSILITMEKLR